MEKARRVNKTTVAGVVKTMKSLKEELASPMTLSDREAFFYDLIIKSREAASWFPHHLMMASLLAKAVARLESINEQLDRSGEISESARGTPIAHPLLSASMQQANTIQALSRSLGLSASQQGLADKQQAKRNNADKTARDAIAKASEDALLA